MTMAVHGMVYVIGEVSKMQYRKKPVVIDAVQWTGYNFLEVKNFCPEIVCLASGHELCIETLEGDHTASVGDWIIKGVAGEYYPCKPDIFEQTYEPVGDEDE